MAMFGGKNDIGIPVSFTDWKKSLDELKTTVKNTSLTVSLKVDNKVYDTIQTKLSDVLEKEYTLNLNYKPVVASISTALKDVLKDVSSSFSNITVSINLNGQKEALKQELKDIPIEIKLEYEKAVKELEKRITDHKATLKISEFVAETDGLDKVATSMQEWFNDPANSVTLFNNKTRIDKTVLVKYLKRLVLEINKAMTTDEALKIAFLPDTASLMKKVDSEIPELEAAVTVPIELDKTKLDTISEDVSKLLDSVTEKLAEVSFDKFIEDVHSVVTEYASTIGSMSQATKTAVDECIANIERIGNMDSVKLPEVDSALKDTLEALVNIANSDKITEDGDLIKFLSALGQAITDFNANRPDTTNLENFASAITSLNTSMGSVATVADTMMNGSFGKLLDAVNGVDTSRLRALTAELSKFARSLSASETFGNLIEAINKVKDAVGDLPNNFETVFRGLRVALAGIRREIRTSIGGISIPAPTVNVSAPASSGTVTIDSADCIVNAVNRVARHVVATGVTNTRTITTSTADIVSAISGISITVTPPAPSPTPPGPGPSPTPKGGGSGEEESDILDANLEKLEKTKEAVKQVADFFRQLNQTGISIPHGLATVVGKISGALQGLSALSKTTQNFETSFLVSLSKSGTNAGRVMAELEKSLRDVGFAGDEIVVDSKGNEEKITEVWRKCAAAAYSYRDALRAKGIRGNELREKTNEYAAKLLEEKTTGKNVVKNASGMVVGEGDIKKYTSLLSSGGKDIIPKLFSSVLGKFSGMFFQVFSKAITRLVSWALTAWGMAIIAAVAIVWKVWRAFMSRRQEVSKRQAQTQLAWTKQQGELSVQYAKQKAQLEQKAIQAGSEIRKKEAEQQMALYEKGMTAYSFEVESQERIYKLELLRLKAAKENEQIQQRIEQINENISKTYEHRKQQMESMLDIKFTNDITNLFGIKKDQGILGNGEKLSDELRDYFGGIGQSINSWLTGTLKREDQEKILQESLKNTANELAELTASDLETIKTSNKAFIDEVTTLQASTTGATRKALGDIIQQYDQWQKSMNVKRRDLVTGREYTLAGRADYVNLMKQDASEYVNTHWNGRGVAMVNEYGRPDAITSETGSKEEVIAKFKQKQQEAQRFIQEIDNWYAQGNIALNEQYKLVRDRAVKEQQINEQIKKTIEAQENLQTELKKKLTDRLVGMWNSFGDWRTTNQSKIQASRMSQLDAFYQMQLANPRFLRNPDAKVALQVQQEQEKYITKNRGDLAVAHDEERFNLEQEQRKALWDLEKQHEMAKHKIEMDNITKISNAQSNNIKLQRELIKRFMDHAVNQFKIYNDPYGRNRYDTQKELATIQIEKKYDAILTNLKKRDNVANTRWEMRQEQKIQDDVMKEQERQLGIKQAAEEAWLKKKQDLELQLLEMEFRLRMKQIKAEVEYKHALEQAQKEMESAGTDSMLGGKEITADELRAIGKNISSDATPEEVRKMVAYLTQEEKNQIATGRMKELDILFGDIEKRLSQDEQYKERYNAERTKAENSILSQTDEKSIVEGMGITVKELKEAITAVKNNSATIDQSLLYNNYMRKNVVLPMAQEIQGKKDEETEKQLLENEKNRKAALEKAKAEYDEQELKRVEEEKKRQEEKKRKEEERHKTEEQLHKEQIEYQRKEAEYRTKKAEHDKWVAEHTGVSEKEELAQRTTSELLASKIKRSRMYLPNGMGAQVVDSFADTTAAESFGENLNKLNLGKYEKELKSLAYQWQEAKTEDEKAEIHKKIEEIMKKGIKEGKGNDTPEPVVPEKPVAPTIPDYLKIKKEEKPEEEEPQAPQESWEAIQERINKEYDALDEETRNRGRAFDTNLDQLASLGESETAAILQQTSVEQKNAEIQQRLLEKLIEQSTPKEEFLDIKKELAKLETERQISMDRLQLTADKSVQRIETQGKADMELQKTAREDAQEGRYAQLEQQKQIASAIKETHSENMKRQDQLNADVVKRNQEYRQTQRGNQTDFAISMMQAKSGTDRLKAISKYRAESDYNAQSAAMDIRHRNEMEALERRGNYTQEEKAQLEARQQDEKSSLDESKKYADAVRDAMGDVGGIRSLVSEGTGQTSDLVGTWERIQAAAFGHIEDPAADAVINMDRAQALQHASLMALLTQQLPVIAQGINSMNYKNIVNNYNNATQGVPPTVSGWS